MPLEPGNTRTFHKTLYGKILQTLTLLKRSNDQLQGTVTTYKLFDCRQNAQIRKQGQSIRGDMSSDHRTTWVIPREQLDRIGIQYLNVLDRFVDKYGRFWNPESNTVLAEHLFSNFYNVDCLRIDPTPGTAFNVP